MVRITVCQTVKGPGPAQMVRITVCQNVKGSESAPGPWLTVWTVNEQSTP